MYAEPAAPTWAGVSSRPAPSSVRRPPMAPTIVTARPSRIQTVPSPMMTIQCQRDHGKRSRRAGIWVSIVRRGAAASAAISSPPGSDFRRGSFRFAGGCKRARFSDMTRPLGCRGMEIEGRHVVVTGGASGIGRAVALRFADEGARAVVVADMDEAGARGVADAAGGLAVRADVGREDEIRALVARAQEVNGPIDLFFSNAGITGPSGGPEVADADWDLLWRVNTMSHVWAARAMVPDGELPVEKLEAVATILEPEQVADAVVEAIGEERFLILPHPEVGTYMSQRGGDHERWLRGMRRLQGHLGV